MHQLHALGFADRDGLTINVGCTPKSKSNHAGGYGLIRIAVDQEKCARIPVFRISIECNRPGDR